MRSKLGIHVNTGRLTQELIEWIARAQPAVAVVLDGAMSEELLKAFKAAGTFVVGRVYVEKQSNWSASQFYGKKLAPKVREYGQWVDAWIGKNEVACNDEYAAWEKKRVELLAGDGARAVVGNFGAGSPGNFNDWQAFLPAIEAALANNGVLGLHCYQLPMQWGTGKLQWNWAAGRPWNEGEGGAPDEKDEGWWTLRYRKVYRHVLPAELRSIPLVITECGVDGGLPPRPGPAAGGWRDKETIKWWTSQGHPDAEAYYLEQLAWYDAELQKDPFVIGGAVYCVSAGSDWGSFELEGSMLDKLGTHILSTHQDGGSSMFDADYPGAAVSPAHRSNYGSPFAARPFVVVLHGTAGPYQAALNWFANPAARASSHYVVAFDGRVAQCVPETHEAYHAGVSEWAGRDDVNAFSIGIELETDKQGHSDWGAAQLDALAGLCKHLAAKYGVAAANVVEHKTIARPVGRKIDPVAFPLDAFKARVFAPPQDDEVERLRAEVARLEGELDVLRRAAEAWEVQIAQARQALESIKGIAVNIVG